MRTYSIRLPGALTKRLDDHAAKCGRDRCWAARRLIDAAELPPDPWASGLIRRLPPGPTVTFRFRPEQEQRLKEVGASLGLKKSETVVFLLSVALGGAHGDTDG